MRWFGNQHIFELGWRGVYIADSESFYSNACTPICSKKQSHDKPGLFDNMN